MNTEFTEENWLRAAMITCPQCKEQLYRVDHSPMADDYHLYCDRCSNSVEVSFYDPVHMKISNKLSIQGKIEYKLLMMEIEKQLTPCDCGGNYRHNTSRRCHYCLYEIITNGSGVDLWPAYYNIDADDEALIEKFIPIVAEFEEKHIRRDNIWK
jgi:hypothetical protein